MPTTDQSTADQWTARWCFPARHLPRPWNTYVQFRRVVDLAHKPHAATVRVSADARYTLYVNSVRVHQGPARCFPEFYSYDTLDIAGLLEPGRNTVCAVVHQFGVPTFQSVYRDASGFLLDGVIELPGEPVPLHTPAGWLCREARGWRKDVSRLSSQLGFQEHYDADADPPDWMSPDYDAAESTGWRTPASVGPVGAHPWLNMEPRGAALLADHVEPFTRIVAQLVGENARGYKIADDVYRLPLQEERRREKSVLDNADAMLRDDGELTIVPPPEDGEFVMVVLDPGGYRTGHVRVDIAEAAGDEIIDIIYTELIEKNGEPLLVESSGSRIATADRYRCRAGSQRWEPFHFKGFRYVTLVFRNVEKPLKLRRVSVRQVHAGVDDIGRFECSDETLNRIWHVARETLRNCMFDAYVDCPWREQAMWWGDARVQFAANAYAFGDVSLLERGVRLLARSQAADGSLHAHPPSDNPWHRLPDFMITWVGTLWDHHFHTGQTHLLQECLPAMHRVFEFLARHENPDGLLGGFDDWWVFLDWQELHKKDFSAVLNLMYLQGLRWAAKISEVAHDAASARQHAAAAERLARAIEQHFWDEPATAWRDGFDPMTQKQIESTSQHAQALAILLDLKPQTHAALAREMLLKPARARRSKVLTASPFFYACVLEAMIKAGLRTEAIELVREKWGDMIDRGADTFWEVWEPGPSHSRCHAWSASPLYHLSQQVLGVVPTAAGWKKVRIAPLPLDLEFARGVVPTPLGPIRIEWEKAEEDQLAVRVDLPEGMEAQFISPVGEARALGPGPHEFYT